MSNLGNVKKGDQVVMLGFTGMRIGEFVVTGATKTELSVESKTGNTLKFSRKTGKQIGLEEDRERYANKIVLPEDAPEPTPKKTKKEEPKKAKEEPKKSKPEPEPVEEDDEEEEEEEEDDLDGILAGMTLTELFKYADENEVDLSHLNKKERKDYFTVIDAIKEALEDDEYEEFDED